MGYERNDRRPGGRRDDRSEERARWDQNRSAGGLGGDRYGSGFGPEGRRDFRGERFDSNRSDYNRRDPRDYGRDPTGYDYQERGFVDRAGDELRSWFGDEDAERRRRADERHYERDEHRGGRFASAGRYGIGSPGDFGYAQANYGIGRDQHDAGQDHGYQSWRDRQIQSFDRDYDEYRREHQQKFDAEFHGWRQNRQGQRDQLTKVQEHFEVVGSDGEHIGTVDHVRDDRIRLTKTDKDAGGHHHSIPSSWIQSVEGNRVTVSKTADQAKAHWRDEERGGGKDFFGGDRDRARSFSGT